MLAFFRRALSSWVVIGLLGLLMVAFIVTGVGTPSSMGVMGGVGSSDVARAGNKTLAVSDVARLMELEFRQARQQKPELTMAQFMQGGILDKMISELSDLMALQAFAETHGMTVSDKLGDAEIASRTEFQGPTGKFDESRYRQLLANNGVTEAQFRADVDQQIALRHLLLPVTASAVPPNDLVRPYAAMLLDRRFGTALDFGTAAFAAGPAPDAAQLTAFYNANKARYTVPEQRVLRYAEIDTSMVAKSAAPTEAEIVAQYKKDAATYAARETRDLTQIIVQDQKVAASIAQKVKAGTSLADAAKAAGTDPIETKGETKASFAGQSADAVAAAAYAAPKGGVVGPVKSAFGWHIVRVDAITVTPGKSLDQVRADIAKALATQKAADAFADLLAGIEEDVANGQTFSDVAKARGLKIVTTPPLMANGAVLGQPGAALEARFAPVLKDAFQAEANDDPALVALGPDKDVFYALDRVIAAAPRPLADIRAQVTADFIADRAAKAARRAAELALGKIQAGEPLGNAGGVARAVTARRLDLLTGAVQPTAELQELFALRPGKAKIVERADKKGWIVVRVDRIAPGDLREDPRVIPAMQEQLTNALGQELTLQFAAAAKAELKIKQNPAAIEALRKSLAGSGAAAR
ncbi:MAG: SurA N-terminal domain-containing protein [Chakrabartia sp.]